MTNVITVVISSRFLTPSEAGAYAVCLAFITIVATVSEFNIVNYAIRADVLDNHTLSSMMGLSIVLTLSIVGMLFAVSGRIIEYLGGGEVASVYYIMIWSLIFFPISLPTVSILRRKMQYRPFFLASIISGAVRMVISVYLLYQHAGVVSLAFAYLVAKAAECLMMILFAESRKFTWPSLVGAKTILTFSILNTISQAAGNLGFSIAEIVAAQTIGLHYAGIYNRGNLLTSVYRTGVERAIIPIAYASISEAYRHNKEDAKAIFERSLSLMTGVGWPAFGGLFLFSDWIVDVAFGAQWKEAVPVTQILSVASGLYILSALSPSVLMASGHSAVLLNRELFIQATRVGFVYLGSKFGVAGVSMGVLLAYALSCLVDFILLRKILPITGRDVFLSVFRSAILLAVVCSSIVTVEMMLSLVGLGGVLGIVLNIIFTVACYLACLAAIKHPLYDEVRALVRSRLKSI